MKKQKCTVPVAPPKNDESLSLREVEVYIKRRGFSVYHVGKMAQAVGNTIVANQKITDSKLIRVKRSDLDAFLDSCATARTH